MTQERQNGTDAPDPRQDPHTVIATLDGEPGWEHTSYSYQAPEDHGRWV